jgi:molecular chaperone HtpG
LAAGAEADADLIEDLVHQFSDRYAFYRELIQNSIDAGSSRIEVRLRHQPSAGRGLTIAEVADWGEGMSRRVIEEYLVTKFRSTKEGDLTKIGKFGIGFLSVFASSPELVVVETGRDGEDWRVLFHPDRTWELLKAPEPLEGTRVILHKEMTAPEYREFAQRSEDAVRRWCRHSHAEVTFAAGGDDGSPPPAPVAVREPLVAEAPFQVEEKDEHTWIVAGPASRDPALAGFYNRGLTLLETREPLVPGVSFKVVSDLLEHTLTRDNVRRDRHFEKVLDRVRALQEGPMRKRLGEELRKAAGAPERAPDYVTLLGYARAQLAEDAIVFPGAGGPVELAALRRAAHALGGVPVGEGSGPVVAALGGQGFSVLVPPPGHEGPVRAAAEALLGRLRDADTDFTVCDEPAKDDLSQALAGAVAGLLRAAGARIGSAAIAAVHGGGRGAVAVRAQEVGRAEPTKDALGSPFAEKTRLLVLRRDHAAVARAAAVAGRRPRLAAFLLARLVALEHAALTEAADARLVDKALSE